MGLPCSLYLWYHFIAEIQRVEEVQAFFGARILHMSSLFEARSSHEVKD